MKKEQNSVLISGAATGMGLKTALTLKDLGWKVYAGILPGQDGSALKGDKENAIRVLELDITDDHLVQEAASLLERELGKNGLKALINNAGVANIGSGVLEGVPMEDAKTCFEINVFGTLRITRAMLPLLRAHGSSRIVNLSSGAARVPVPTAGIYNMSKMAVNGLSNTLRLELAPFGITVVAVEPGAVQTPMTQGAHENLEAVWKTIPGEIRMVYEPKLKRANQYLLEQIDRADPPEYIIKKGILPALLSRNPKPRYTVGSEARFLPIAQKLLSEKRFERILMKQYGIQSKSI